LRGGQVKKDYVEELGDSLDLVPIGAWWGNGRYIVSATRMPCLCCVPAVTEIIL
jgi:hypothetical protein